MSTEENKDSTQMSSIEGTTTSDSRKTDSPLEEGTRESGKESKKIDDEGMKHIRELREENKARRLEAKALKEQVEKAMAMVNLANSRVIRTELRTKASQMGIIDLDVLDLPNLDKSAIKLDDNGNVLGVDEFLATVKTQKPHLFTDRKSVGTSSVVTPPATASKTTENEERRKKLMGLSPSEAKKERSRFVEKFRS
jgi:hypothetical protein